MHAEDKRWMQMALRLAVQAKGRTSPNPLVGAVLVKDGEVVGSGYHHKAGEPHAEVLALRAAGEKARGAELFVTLEPCSHFGRTPPCANAVIAAGVRRVVAAMTDPNPRVAGRGLERLRQAGIQVETGLLADEAKEMNASYITYITKARPHVTWKTAATLDGKCATRTGASKWITGPAARALTHQTRALSDAIMVGCGTVIQDDPLLTARIEPPEDGEDIRQPVRLVADSRLRIPATARCLQPDLPGRVIVATTDLAPDAKVDALRALGVEVWREAAVDGRVDLPRFLHDLASMEITTILLEGGPALAGKMLDLHLIDSCMVFIAPLVFGGADALPVLGGLGVDSPAQAPRVVNPVWRKVGDDLLLEGRLCWPDSDKTGGLACSPD